MEIRKITYDVNEKGCWVCNSHSLCKGYPQVWRNGRRWLISRLVLTEKLGRNIAEGLYALHKCNEPKCVNPDHIYEGTQLDNMRDSCNSGSTHGPKLFRDKNPNSKLSAIEVGEIQNSQLSSLFLSRKYGVSKNHITKLQRLGRSAV